MEDYMELLNIRDGGIGGVKLTWEECETAYNSDRGVECYERLKGKGPTGAGIVHPLSTGITYRLIERATTDKIPLISMGYGRTDATNGKVFPYVFPLVTNYWSQNTAKIKYIGMKEGGMGSLEGKKIANLYHESSYGKETIPVLNKQAEMYGFEVRHFPVPHPGLDQKATWLEIARRYKPDWVILRGWGVMNPTALKEASRVGFPATKIVGVWWSGAEEDVIPAGKAAVGYVAAGFHPSGAGFPGHPGDPRQGARGRQGPHLAAARRARSTTTAASSRGSSPWRRSATRRASSAPSRSPARRIRWGIESLDVTEARIEELGAEGLMSPLKVSCADHEGGGAVKFLEWTGSRVEGGHRLDRDRQVDRQSDDPGVLLAVRHGEGHHPA